MRWLRIHPCGPALAMALAGCQVVAGISDLETVEGGTGGGAGAAGSASQGGGSTGGAGTSTSMGTGLVGDGGTMSPCPNGHGDCAEDLFCNTPKTCINCGAPGPQGEAMCDAAACDTCLDTKCVETCDTAGECTDDLDLPTTGPVEIDCVGQCNNITINCRGLFPCKVTCGPGGCQNLKLNCDVEQACTLDCEDMSCGGSVEFACGNSTCSATCSGPNHGTVSIGCGPKCACDNGCD